MIAIVISAESIVGHFLTNPPTEATSIKVQVLENDITSPLLEKTCLRVNLQAYIIDQINMDNKIKVVGNNPSED